MECHFQTIFGINFEDELYEWEGVLQSVEQMQGISTVLNNPVHICAALVLNIFQLTNSFLGIP